MKSSDVVFSEKVRFARVPSRYNHENNSGLQWSGWSVANIRPKYKHFPIPTAANLPSWAEMEKLYSIITKCWDFLLLHFVKFPFCLSTQGEVCGRPAARNTNTSFVCGEMWRNQPLLTVKLVRMPTANCIYCSSHTKTANFRINNAKLKLTSLQSLLYVSFPVFTGRARADQNTLWVTLCGHQG